MNISFTCQSFFDNDLGVGPHHLGYRKRLLKFIEETTAANPTISWEYKRA